MLERRLGRPPSGPRGPPSGWTSRRRARAISKTAGADSANSQRAWKATLSLRRDPRPGGHLDFSPGDPQLMNHVQRVTCRAAR